MENITKQQIIQSIGKVYEQAKDSKLETSFFESIETELQILSQYFKTSKHQTFFISIVFALNYKGGTVDMNDLISYFDCNPMKILEYSEDFDYLYQQKMLTKQNTPNRLRAGVIDNQFVINEKITKAILLNQALPAIIETNKKDVLEFLEELYNLSEQRSSKSLSTSELYMEANILIDNNEHFPLIQQLKHFNFAETETYLFLVLAWTTISGSKSTSIDHTLEMIYDNASVKIAMMQQLIGDSHPLIQQNLVEIKEAVFFNDSEMSLTDTAHQLLNNSSIKLFLNKKKKDNILLPEEIVKRELYFDKEDMSQIFTIQQLLEEDKLLETQQRLTAKGLPKGIAILLHGAPGTGKTEIVKQLAKATHRSIMKVEISQSKSMWFGESQKIVKRIFTDYKAFAKECDQMPILLFNEADAIIGKRVEGDNAAVSQTENAIQNILLEEFENFEGILMATTNLASNLDSAFERRFLFKVLFRQPKIKERAQIWQSKLTHLKAEEYHTLAAQFDMSGGQIDNIVRKCEIQEILHGTVSTLAHITAFCKEEGIQSKNTKIGFGNAHN